MKKIKNKEMQWCDGYMWDHLRGRNSSVSLNIISKHNKYVSEDHGASLIGLLNVSFLWIGKVIPIIEMQ